MKLAKIVLAALILPLGVSWGGGLAGCATTHLTASKAYVAGEAAFDAAVVTADNAVKAGAVSPAGKARLIGLVNTGYVTIKAARAARRVGATADVAVNTAALTALAAQIQTLASGAAQ